MKFGSKSIRPFLGSKNFDESRRFYDELGFEEFVINPKLSFFDSENAIGFYLQDYYEKKWVNNTMVFYEVDDVTGCYEEMLGKKFDTKYKYARVTELKEEGWGTTFNLYDPSGILWFFGSFSNRDNA